MASTRTRKHKRADEQAFIVPIGSIKPWAKNPRANEQAVGSIAASIERFDFNAPIIVCRKTNEIVAGHTRYKAAQQLGLTEVPIRYTDLTPERAYEYAIADNKLGEIAKWDNGILSQLLTEYRADFNLPTMGFNDKELKLSIGGVVEVAAPIKPAHKPKKRVEVESSDLDPMCWINVAVPLHNQSLVLDALRDALESIEGVKLTIKVFGVGQSKVR
jgi:hypothetical protein